MTQPPPLYTAEGLAVETYDHAFFDLQGSTAGDVNFYLEEAQRLDGPVLELGCGTGRVAWALARAGLEVIGLEIAEPMRRRAEAKRAMEPAEAGGRISFLAGDMTNFALQRRFALIIAPFRAFQHVLNPIGQKRCLACLHRHLLPGGRLVLHLFDPRLDYLLPDSRPSSPVEAPHPVSGHTLRREVIDRRIDPLRQVVEEVWRDSEVDSRGKVLRSEEARLSLRWTYRWEMRHLLELCGFEAVADYADFERSPPAYGREQIWVAEPR